MPLWVTSPFSIRIILEMLKQQASKPQPQTGLPISTAGKPSRFQSPIPRVVLRQWPSNPHELEAQLRVQAGDWCSRETLLYCGPGTSLGGLCPPEHSQDREAKTLDGSFSAALGANPGPCNVFKMLFFKIKETPPKRYKWSVNT